MSDKHDALFDNLRAAGSGPSPNDPTPPKPKRPVPTVVPGAYTVRPDALPARPAPRMIPFFTDWALKNKDIVGIDSVMMPDPDQPTRPLPFKMPLNREKVPEELYWQAPFLDTLSQLTGHQPGKIAALAFPSNYVAGRFTPRGSRISLVGNIVESSVSQPDMVRWSASHEWAHLLTAKEQPILKAFMEAAPLPKRLRTDPGYDYNEWPSELVAGEAFADMFADALAERFPMMEEARTRKAAHYSFTDQFRGRNRRRMVDSLVNTFLPRLENE